MPKLRSSVSGWYELLCLLLLVCHPLRAGLAASGALDAVLFGSVVVIVALIVQIAVAGLGFAAGLALLGRRGVGVTLAKASMIASGATDLFILLTPYVPGNRAPGETPILVALTVAYYAGWLSYLYSSKRVREVADGTAARSDDAFRLTTSPRDRQGPTRDR
jgi:hypothetical protein